MRANLIASPWAVIRAARRDREEAIARIPVSMGTLNCNWHSHSRAGLWGGGGPGAEGVERRRGSRG